MSFWQEPFCLVLKILVDNNYTGCIMAYMSNEELKTKELEALKCIRNFLMHSGKAPSVRQLMGSLGYKSPRSISLIIDSLVEKGMLVRRKGGELRLVMDLEANNTHARTVNIPLVGSVACGAPVFAEENIEAMIPVSVKLVKPGSKYFLLRANGDSMDAAGINDGDLVLVKQQAFAENGDHVVALIDDEATIKEYRRATNSVVLKPSSTNKQHQPIILTDNFQVQGVVVSTIPKF